MYLYGASGHGKVIKDILESQGRAVDGFIDDNPDRNDYAGLSVRHDVSNTDEIIVSIGYNDIRKRIAERVDGTFAAAAVHEKAIVSESVTLGEGTVVMAGAVINADTNLGKHCIVNTGASVDHECVIGDFVHIAPHATLCGQVKVGEGTLIGVGASVVQCVTIGKWCKIGAGAVVLGDIPDGATVVGVPGRIINYRKGYGHEK